MLEFFDFERKKFPENIAYRDFEKKNFFGVGGRGGKDEKIFFLEKSHMFFGDTPRKKVWGIYF